MPLASKTNYLKGPDQSYWLTGVENFQRVRFADVYPGVDVVYYGDRRQMEYDLVLRPGADPSRVSFRLEGADRVQLGKDGSLAIAVASHKLRLLPPNVYQQTSHGKQAVRALYVRTGHGRYGFELGAFDRRRELVIDPVLLYSTYYGSSDGNSDGALAVDANGFVYVSATACQPSGADFPTTLGAMKATHGTDCDLVISKFTPSLSSLVFSTFFGGNGDEFIFGGTNVDNSKLIGLDSAGNIYVAGVTTSTDYPFEIGQPHAGLDSVFLAKLNSQGNSVLYSRGFGSPSGGGFNDTFLMSVDGNGNVYLENRAEASDLPAVNSFRSPIAAAYRSVDSGANWTVSSTGLVSIGLRDLTVSPSSPGTVLGASSAGGFSKSTDYGQNWTQLRLNTAIIGGTGQCRSVAADPFNSQIVYVGTFFDGIFKSVDAGANFTQITSGLVDPNNPSGSNPFTVSVFSIVIDPTNTNTLYVGTSLGVYKSTDGGANWNPVNNGFDMVTNFDFFQVFGLAIDLSNPNILYATINGTEDGVSAGLWKTANGGANWVQTTLNAQPGNTVSAVGTAQAVAIDPANSQVIYAGASNGPWKSIDGGGVFTKIATGFLFGTVTPTVQKIVVDPTNSLNLYAATVFGTFRTVDGGANWTTANNGNPNLDIRGVVVFPDQPNIVLAGGTKFDLWLAKFDPNGFLVYSSALGVDKTPTPRASGVDSNGAFYVAGGGAPTNLATPGAFQTFIPTATPGFVVRVSPAGGSLDYATYLRGNNGNTQAFDLAPQSDGSVWVTGFTNSTSFPVVSPFQATRAGGNDAFVSHLNSSGTGLLYSTYFGGTGNDQGRAIQVDGSGNVFIAGTSNSSNLTTVNAFQPSFSINQVPGTQDTFVAEFTNGGASLGLSSYLGGEGFDDIKQISLDQTSGQLTVLGTTNSFSFPTLAGGYKTSPVLKTFPGSNSFFLAKIGTPTLELSPQVLQFPATTLGTDSSPLSITVTNRSASSVMIKGIFLFLDFKQTNDCPQVLSPGAICTIQVVFHPIGINYRRSSIFIYTDAQATPYQANARGTGLSGPVLNLSTAALNFPNTLVGAVSNPMMVKVSNAGNVAVNIASVTPPGGYTEVTNCPAALNARNSCSIGVRFAPGATGPITGNLVIIDDAPGSPHNIALSGTGLAGRPRVQLDALSLDFGTVFIPGSNGPLVVFLTNTGSGTLNISTIRILGDYSETTDCAATLAPGNSCHFGITFSPRFTGTRKGVLQVLTNAPSSPNYIKLTGIGSIPQ